MALFDFDQISIDATPSLLLELFSEEQIYRHYYPDFKIGTVSSPFRKDNNPSFRFYDTTYSDRDVSVFWNDQKTGESGSVFMFVQKAYKEFKGIELTLRQVYNQIMEDMKGAERLVTQERMPARQRSTRKSNTSGGTIIQAELHPSGGIPLWALAYWAQLGIGEAILKDYHVGYADRIWIIKYVNGERKQYLWAESTEDNPIFFYYFPRTRHMKAYRPLEPVKKFKWISNVTNATDVQGYYQCRIKKRKPALLVLTKSMKDVMWLRSVGVDAMAIHGERHTFTPEFIAHLRRHCGHIISVYDNDFPGMRGALKLWSLFGIPYYFIPRATGAKDITDLYKLDRRKLFDLIEQLKEHLDGNHHQHTRRSDAAVTGVRDRAA